MPEAPYITGSNITSNPGNAALGYSGTGIKYNANPADSNPFAGIQSTISQLHGEEIYNRQKYAEQQQQEHKDLAQFLADTRQSVFNMKGEDGKSTGFSVLPEDRSSVNLSADNLRKKIASNPRTWKFDPEIQRMIQDHDQLVRHAGIRAVDVAKKNALLSSSNSAEERAAIGENINKTKSQGIQAFAFPDPYVPQLTANIEEVYPGGMLSGKNKDVMDDIVVGTQTTPNGEEVITQSGIRGAALDTRSKLVPGTKEFDIANNYVRRFYSNPSFMSPQNILHVNEVIDEYNKQRGYTEQSGNYAPHIAEVLPNGQVKAKPLTAKNTADIFYSLMAEHAGQLGKSTEIKRTPSVLAKEKHDIADDKEKANQEWERIKIARENLKSNKAGMSVAQQKYEEEKLTGEELGASVYKTILPSREGKVLSEVTAGIKDADISGLATALGAEGVSMDDYKAISLPKSNILIRNIAAIAPMDEKGIAKQGMVGKPEYAYVVTPNTGDLHESKFIFGYTAYQPKVDDKGLIEYEEDGKTPKREKYTEWKVIPVKEAVNTQISGKNNLGPMSDADKLTAQRGMNKLSELLGDQPSAAAPQQADKNTIPAAIKKIVPVGGSAIPIEESGKTYYQVGDKFYDKTGKEIK